MPNGTKPGGRSFTLFYFCPPSRPGGVVGHLSLAVARATRVTKVALPLLASLFRLQLSVHSVAAGYASCLARGRRRVTAVTSVTSVIPVIAVTSVTGATSTVTRPRPRQRLHWPQ